MLRKTRQISSLLCLFAASVGSVLAAPASEILPPRQFNIL